MMMSDTYIGCVCIPEKYQLCHMMEKEKYYMCIKKWYQVALSRPQVNQQCNCGVSILQVMHQMDRGNQ